LLKTAMDPAWRQIEDCAAGRAKSEVSHAKHTDTKDSSNQHARLQEAIARIAETNKANKKMKERLERREAMEDSSQLQLSVAMEKLQAEFEQAQMELAHSRAELAAAKAEIARLGKEQEQKTDDLMEALVENAKSAAYAEALEKVAEERSAVAEERERLRNLNNSLENHLVAMSISKDADLEALLSESAEKSSWWEVHWQALVGSAAPRRVATDDAIDQQQQACCFPCRLLNATLADAARRELKPGHELLEQREEEPRDMIPVVGG